MTWNRIKFIESIESTFVQIFKRIDEIAYDNQARVLRAFQRAKVSEAHLAPSTGYGYDCLGRDGLEGVYADVFGAEAALVRPQLISGTHAIATALFGLLRPGDHFVSITGEPYDTLTPIIGQKIQATGSLKEFGVTYEAVPLLDGWTPDKEAIIAVLQTQPRLIAIQRSRGYANRPSFTVKQIEELITLVKTISPETICFVDNCYGEFVESEEPTHVGADIMAGSLIKNPGGGLAKTGGYLVGEVGLIEACAARLTAPGIGAQVGPNPSGYTDFFQGLFMAPHTVAQAVKGAHFTAKAVEHFGLDASPHSGEVRTDLVQSVTFHDAKRMIAFCQAIQHASPINAHVTPYPGYMPGYEDDVIMAAGTFIQGASLELTADGPIRAPYTAFIQGGLTYEHVKYAICSALETCLEKGTLQQKEPAKGLS
ncbi:methionine gamma-lyase family protein [Bacillus fonticola]|uniref:methionine gamma-lyase family protein n=1 Tax=Bacillus fonticola TaxID=2728853 RepID=UPI0014730AAD|nr:methionine gamma-lyase family protein [Bacillus fonticola]